MKEISQASKNILSLYEYNKNITVEIARAIVSDIVEINLGLDYGSTNGKTDEELYGLYCLLSVMPKNNDSAKGKLLNSIKTMSESQAKNILNNE